MSAVSAAIHLADRFALVIIPAGEKGPNHAGWQHTRATPAQVDRAIHAGLNVGIILGPPSDVIDIEIDGEGGEESRRKLFDDKPPEGPSWQSFRGKHYLSQWDDRFADLGAKLTHPDYPGLEFRIGGGDKGAQSVCPPSKVDGVKREWIHEGEPAALPESVILKILAIGNKPKAAVVQESIYGSAQQDKLARLLAWAERFDVPMRLDCKNDKGTIVLKFDYCPLRGHADGGATLFVNDDASHIFFCHHSKCGGKGFADLEAKYGPFSPPKIVTGPDLHRVASEAINAIRRANVYNRGGILTELVTEAPQPRLCLSDNAAPRARPVPVQSLTMLLSEHARFHAEVRTKNGVKLKRIAPPAQIAGAIIASHNLPRIPVITGVVSCPVLRADGSIATKPGYDKLTGLYLDIDGGWPAPMSVAEAVRWFDDIFCDFPFALPAHKSAAIAALVTMVSRHAFAGPAPGFTIDGNASRIGKGLLSDLFTMATEGRKASRMSFSEDDAEMRKVLTSAAIAGVPYVLFDNCKGRFGGRSLEAAMTSGRWCDRILGTNQTIDVAFNPVWLATANNATITPDMVGRLLMCKLRTTEESPGSRTDFRHPDLLGYAMQHRRELAMAALSIPYRFMQAGCPKQPINAWGGFDGWNDLVRASLVWAGLPDLDTRAQVAEESDEESSILRQLMEAWPKGEWSVSALIKLGDSDELREIIAELPGADKAAAIGRMLRDSHGRVLGGKRFVRTGGHSRRKWTVEAI